MHNPPPSAGSATLDASTASTKVSAEVSAEVSVELAAELPAGLSAGQSIALGQLIVFTGPSGVGKGTLLRRLLSRHPEVQLSVSATTRPPRANEVHGQHYYFVSREEFQQMIAAGSLLEWAEFADNFYGTPLAPLTEKMAQGKSVILEIELAGARQVRQSFPKALTIFILPPSLATLEARIRQRGQDSEAAIAKRLAQAQIEIAAAPEFDVQIVNDDFEQAFAALETAILGDRNGCDA